MSFRKSTNLNESTGFIQRTKNTLSQTQFEDDPRNKIAIMRARTDKEKFLLTARYWDVQIQCDPSDLGFDKMKEKKEYKTIETQVDEKQLTGFHGDGIEVTRIIRTIDKMPSEKKKELLLKMNRAAIDQFEKFKEAEKQIIDEAQKKLERLTTEGKRRNELFMRQREQLLKDINNAEAIKERTEKDIKSATYRYDSAFNRLNDLQTLMYNEFLELKKRWNDKLKVWDSERLILKPTLFFKNCYQIEDPLERYIELNNRAEPIVNEIKIDVTDKKLKQTKKTQGFLIHMKELALRRRDNEMSFVITKTKLPKNEYFEMPKNEIIHHGMSNIITFKKRLYDLLHNQPLQKGWHYLGPNKINKHKAPYNQPGLVYIYLGEYQIRMILMMLHRWEGSKTKTGRWINVCEGLVGKENMTIEEENRDKLAWMFYKDFKYMEHKPENFERIKEYKEDFSD
jgi:hypothetical protein